MAESSARFELPYIVAGQAQKELFHNEALALIDAALHPVAEGFRVDAPPPLPAPGQCWIVGDAPTGAWAARPRALAAWTESGWRFVVPTFGMTVWLAGDNLPARYDGSDWQVGEIRAARVVVDDRQVLGGRQPAIADPVGGSTVDANARAALSLVLSTLRTHGLID